MSDSRQSGLRPLSRSQLNIPFNPIEKRGQKRVKADGPAELDVLEGQVDCNLLNISRNGALLLSSGRIEIVLRHGGKEYRGRLVRAVPAMNGEMTYAVQLSEPQPVPEG